ncbi:peptidoglycan-binding protein [Ferrovibrio sp.]|uniref:peptidoglycan-binding protein n=1 Tax=Ferrovibrio sp. TaxID=1917215 RepID=UPI0035136B69
MTASATFDTATLGSARLKTARPAAAPGPFTLPGFALPGPLRRLLAPDTAMQPALRQPAADPLARLRAAWQRGASLRELFGETVFVLRDSVGAGGANHAADVVRLQALLHREGDLDGFATGGPTGLWDACCDAALRRFQAANGLAADGIARPGGATLRALRGFYLPEEAAAA